MFELSTIYCHHETEARCLPPREIISGFRFELVHEISNSGMCDQQSFRSACAYAQSDQSLCKSLEYSMTVKLLTEHHLEFLSLKGGCTGSAESTLVNATLLEITYHDSFCLRVFNLLRDHHLTCPWHLLLLWSNPGLVGAVADSLDLC